MKVDARATLVVMEVDARATLVVIARWDEVPTWQSSRLPWERNDAGWIAASLRSSQ
jgi:hypothetical protein